VNKNTLKGAVIDAVGRIQQRLGRLIGSPRQEVKGVAKRVVGTTQKAAGKAQAAIGRNKRRSKKA